MKGFDEQYYNQDRIGNREIRIGYRGDRIKHREDMIGKEKKG